MRDFLNPRFSLLLTAALVVRELACHTVQRVDESTGYAVKNQQKNQA